MSVSEDDNQTVQQPSSSENPTKPAGMLTYFWWAILALISVIVVLLILVAVNQISQPEDELTEAGPSCPELLAQAERKLEEDLRARAERRAVSIPKSVLHAKLFKATDNAIDKEINLAFRPMYEGIPQFLDWHYSMRGQYQQLGTATLRWLSDIITQPRISQMIPQEIQDLISQEIQDLKIQIGPRELLVGIPERLEKAAGNIDTTFKDEFRSLISQGIQDEVQAVDNEVKAAYEHGPECRLDEAKQRARLNEVKATYKRMLERTLDKTVQRFVLSVPSAGSAAFRGAKALSGGITRAISKKLSASLVAKAATKKGGAASGGAIGSFLGPVGAAVGGIIGAISGWVAVDIAGVAVDKHFNRDKFRQKLETLIKEQEEEVKSLLQEAQFKKLEEFSKTLDNVPPAQIRQ